MNIRELIASLGVKYGFTDEEMEQLLNELSILENGGDTEELQRTITDLNDTIVGLQNELRIANEKYYKRFMEKINEPTDPTDPPDPTEPTEEIDIAYEKVEEE